MTSLTEIKSQILANRRLGVPHFTDQPLDKPIYDFVRGEVRKETDQQLGFQPQSIQQKEKKKKKKKHKRPPIDPFTRDLLNCAANDSSDEEQQAYEDEDDEHLVPWKGPNLEKPLEVMNLESVVKSLKKENVVFDGGATKEGKRSDENFFKWLEEYARLEHKRQKQSDDAGLLGGGNGGAFI